MKPIYDYASQFEQPRLDLSENPSILIHAGSRANLNENLVMAAELNRELNNQFKAVITDNAPNGEAERLSFSHQDSPFSFYIMQRCCPSPAVRAATAEGTHYIISLETRSDSSAPSKGGQIIEYATPTGQLLAAYLQQGIASCPYARRLPETRPTYDDSHIATVAAKEGVHAVRVICGYTTNDFDSHLLNAHRDSFISALAKAAFKFLTNNPIKVVKK